MLAGGHLTDQDAYALRSWPGSRSAPTTSTPAPGQRTSAARPRRLVAGRGPEDGMPAYATGGGKGRGGCRLDRNEEVPSCGCGCARTPSAGACRWWPSGRGGRWPSSPPLSPPCPGGQAEASSASAAVRATPAPAHRRGRGRGHRARRWRGGATAGWPAAASWPRPWRAVPGCRGVPATAGPSTSVPAGPPPRGAAVADAAVRGELAEAWGASCPRPRGWTARPMVAAAAAGELGVLILAGVDSSATTAPASCPPGP